MQGKWDAGMWSIGQTPAYKGFDSYLGYLNTGEYKLSHCIEAISSETISDFQCYNSSEGMVDLWTSHGHVGGPALGMDGVFGDVLYATRAVEIIEAHDARVPLFLYLALQSVHEPYEGVPNEYVHLQDMGYFNCEGRCEETADLSKMMARDYYALLSVVDDAVANVTAKLRSKGMWEHTLFVFSSDNGGSVNDGFVGPSNWPLRGGKMVAFEGGVRVAAFVSGGFLPSTTFGTSNSLPLHMADLYATFCALAGAADCDDAVTGVNPVDGVDVWSVLAEGGETTSLGLNLSDRVIYLDSWDGRHTVMKGRYKLLNDSSSSYGWSGPLPLDVPTGTEVADCAPCLFDVVSDPREENDLFSSQPELAAELLAIMMQQVDETIVAGYDNECQEEAALRGYAPPSCYAFDICTSPYGQWCAHADPSPRASPVARPQPLPYATEPRPTSLASPPAHPPGSGPRIGTPTRMRTWSR